MALTILNNIAALAAENQLNITSSNLNSTLEQLSSGSRINSGADDPAGLAIANGLEANVAALTQSASNATDGVGELQVADGSLSQVTTLLDRAVTLATEAATGTVSDSQRTAIDTEYQSIKAEIDSIGSTTNYNGGQVFTNNTLNVFLSDGSTSGSSNIGVSTGILSSTSLLRYRRRHRYFDRRGVYGRHRGHEHSDCDGYRGRRSRDRHFDWQRLVGRCHCRDWHSHDQRWNHQRW